MKLYYSPGVCSLAPHIALHEAGVPHTSEKVDLKTKQFSGGDYRKINAKGSVPTLQLDNGDCLTEGPAILQYIADQKPESNLVPKAGTWDRYRAQEWLNFITSEIHKGFVPLFAADRWVANKEGNEQLKASAKEALGNKISYLAEILEAHPYLMGANFSIADAYLYTCLRWSDRVGIDLQRWTAIAKFMDRVSARPMVQAALKAEGLVK